MIQKIEQLIDEWGGPRPFVWALYMAGWLWWGIEALAIFIMSVGWTVICWAADVIKVIAQWMWERACDVVDCFLRALRIGLEPIVSAIAHLGKVLFFVPILFVLSMIVFGFAAPFRVAFEVAVWLLTHPAEDWIGIRILAAALLAWFVMIMIQLLFRPEYQPGPSPTQLPRPYIAPPPRTVAIDHFRERSAYGDAALPSKSEVAVALSTERVNSEPLFDE